MPAAPPGSGSLSEGRQVLVLKIGDGDGDGGGGRGRVPVPGLPDSGTLPRHPFPSDARDNNRKTPGRPGPVAASRCTLPTRSASSGRSRPASPGLELPTSTGSAFFRRCASAAELKLHDRTGPELFNANPRHSPKALRIRSADRSCALFTFKRRSKRLRGARRKVSAVSTMDRSRIRHRRALRSGCPWVPCVVLTAVFTTRG
jgi:hypothetical protein